MVVLVAVHNIVRWVIVLLAVVSLFRAYRGWLGKREWQEADRKSGVFFSIALDTQLLIGIILWIFGEWGLKAFNLASSVDSGSRMSVLYFALEHTLTMLIAVVLVHIGTATTKRIKDSTGKHKRTAIFFSAAVLLILVAIPWTQRPLFPGF